MRILVGASSCQTIHRRILRVVALALVAAPCVFGQTPRSGATLTITSEPNAIVWIDEIRRGTTNANGKLSVPRPKPGRHTLRVRAIGFKEVTLPLAPNRREVTVKLVPTTDRAELAFQKAEAEREAARDDAAREQAAESYRNALELRPNFPAAHLGLARVLLSLDKYNDALDEIAAARRGRPVYPEASAVEGRIHREAAFDEEAIRSFRRAIQEAKGFQPEARVGLALLLEEKGRHQEAIAELRKAIEQLSDSEPVIYQMLGAAYEKTQQYQQAIVAYEKYLELAPNGSLAPAVRSIMDQLKRDATGLEIIP